MAKPEKVEDKLIKGTGTPAEEKEEERAKENRQFMNPAVGVPYVSPSSGGHTAG